MQQHTWKTVPTRQFKEIIASLENSKAASSTAMIIAPTGIGKTFTIDTYCNKADTYTYRITVSDLYRKENIIEELERQLELNLSLSYYSRKDVKGRLDNIVNKLIDLKREGKRPQIIFDEAENMKITPLKMIKALYDAVKNKCSIVLIGTDQLLNNVYLNRGKRNRHSLPQLYRRFKAGLNVLTPIDKEEDYTPFFKAYNIPVGLQKLLISICENYGDFNDFLEPAILECQAAGKTLTEEYFRIKYKMPNKLTKVS